MIVLTSENFAAAKKVTDDHWIKGQILMIIGPIFITDIVIFSSNLSY